MPLDRKGPNANKNLTQRHFTTPRFFDNLNCCWCYTLGELQAWQLTRLGLQAAAPQPATGPLILLWWYCLSSERTSMASRVWICDSIWIIYWHELLFPVEVTGFQPSEENCWKKCLHVDRRKFPYFSVHRKPDPYKLFLIVQTNWLYLAILHNPQWKANLQKWKVLW